MRLLLRWHAGGLTVQSHPTPTACAPRAAAFGIGLVHGMGGSAGVGILIVASVESTALAVLALGLLALFTAVSMTILTTGFGRALVSRPVSAAFGQWPALGVASLAFGVWYGAAAWSVFPYPL